MAAIFDIIPIMTASGTKVRAILAAQFAITAAIFSPHAAQAQLFGQKAYYADPALYLTAGSQSSVSMSVEELRKKTGVAAGADADVLVPALFNWLSSSFTASAEGGLLIGKTTADGLLQSRSLSGCHDWALLFSSVARKLGYPSLIADAAGIKWARKYKGKGGFSGHVLAEVYVGGSWVLVDAVSGRYIKDYDPQNLVIPLRVGGETEGLYVLFKGLDPESYGIVSNEQLQGKMKTFAKKLPGLTLIYPEYTVSYSRPEGGGIPSVSEEDAAGECRQAPCRRHPCKGVVVQAGEWDLLVEKQDGTYYAHHYPRGYIFSKEESKVRDFLTLKEVNDYITSLAK